MRWVRNPLSFEMFWTARTLLKGSYNIKAILYGFLAVLLSWIYTLGPLGVGVYLLTQGEILRGILAPVFIYLYVGLFLAFWPVWFLLGWYHEGFVPSLLGTGITALILLAPDWLMARAMRAAGKAAAIDAESMEGEGSAHVKPPLTATTPAAVEQRSREASQDALFLAMGQRADTIRGAYVNVMERKVAGYFRPESELPTSKDRVKAALLLSAWTLKSTGKLSRELHDAYQVAYGHVADFVSNEFAARSRKEAELLGKIPEMHPGIDRRWLEGFGRDHILGEEYRRLGHEFIRLCEEFDRRLEALDAPSRMAQERMFIQRALVEERVSGVSGN